MGTDKTLSVISVFFILLYLLTGKILFLYISFGLLVTYNFIPKIDKSLSSLWLKLSYLLGTVNTKIILAIVWFLILTPLALIRRPGKNLLRLKKPEISSYWDERNIKFDKSSLEKGW